MAEPDEIAAAVEHLASPDTTATVGALLAVDGGFSVYGGVGDAAEPGAVRAASPEGPRVALIAGAASAIGRATAARLEGAGVRVVRLEADDVAAVGAAEARFGRIDLLVVAADGPASPAFGPGFDDAVIRALTLAQAAVPVMARTGGGAIVNVGASAAAGGGQAAAREMMAMLSRSLACEWARHGVRVNTVIPGGSDMAGVAAAIDFLGSHDASYVTGATYVADGGAAALQRS